MRFHEKFFPTAPPTPQQQAQSRRFILAEEAIAGAIFSLGTGNFLVGYLTWMGASPAFSALVGGLPMLGCILQAVSPFLFERLRRRKLCVVLLCFGFRFSMGLAAFVPLLLREPAARQAAVFALYFLTWMLAGFVTPGLNQWILSSAPQEGRGRFFALKNILSSLFNAALTFLMGRQLDWFIGRGQPQTGYFIVYGSILLLTLVDILLLSEVWETPAPRALAVRPRDFLRPFRDPAFRPVILFDTLRYTAANFSSAFLPVYLLQGLNLSHSYISIMALAASATGILCNWVWGRLADRRGWRPVLVTACATACCGYIGWFFVKPAAALFIAPVLQCVSTAGTAGFGLATLNMEYAASPQEGKTVYLGAVAVVSNLMGYAATLAGSAIQSALEGRAGVQASISVLFLLSAAGMLVCLWHARRLPEK